MATKRKKWKVTYTGNDAVDQFPSEKKTYEWLRSLAATHAANPSSMDPRVKVWVNEGDSRGWQLYDDLNLSEWR
ncbi:hypothetical protein ABZ949_02085 [Micromonospora tulbaghiae]|uniref:hypothetical protein n=1 Tax=Micromonospora tulbaghiae TaxID=479978 RepID=UPI0033F6D0B2